MSAHASELERCVAGITLMPSLAMLKPAVGARTGVKNAPPKKRGFPASLGPAGSETKTKGWVGEEARLVIGVTTSNDFFLVHCGLLPTKIVTLNKKLEGLRYALLAHLIVFSSEFREDCPTEKSEMLELFPTASAALEETLTPGGGVFTFTEWNDHILHWFPSGGPNGVVRANVALPSTDPPELGHCSLPEGVAKTGVQWHSVTMNLNKLQEWSERIEEKARDWFETVWTTVVKGDPDGPIDQIADDLRSVYW